MGIKSAERYWIDCDGVGCVHGTDYDDLHSMESAIDEAIRIGWQNVDGKYLCPKCNGRESARKAGT
jgi:hypothetical protein